MTRGCLIDTDVLIWALRNHQPTVRLLQHIGAESVPRCSTVTVYEVWAGVRPGEESVIEQLFDSLKILPMTEEIAVKGAEYWRNHSRVKPSIGKGDMLIAATAIVHNLTLVTYNRSDFPMPDITLYDDMPVI